MMKRNPALFRFAAIPVVAIALPLFLVTTFPSSSSFPKLFAREQKKPEQAAPPVFGLVLTAEHGFSGNPKEMMKTFLLGKIAEKKAAWKERYETLKTVDDVAAYVEERRTLFRENLGQGWDPDTPLNAKVTKTFEKGTPGKDAYRVEMVLFESVPGFYVTAAVFLPDPTRFEPPYPAVLVPCGHTHIGKAGDIYQQAPALAATHGLAAMVFDPIDQGERSQRLNDDGTPVAQGVAAHNVLGATSIPLGRNAATFEVRDLVRAVDYLQSRDDVLGEKIGVTGTSGGGTQSSYLMVLDERILAAAPSCYLCDLHDLVGGLGPQDAEQNIFGQLGFGMGHADYCIMRAPKPTLIVTTTEDFFPVEGAWSAYRNAKRIYDRFGYAEKMAIMEHDAEHGWQKNLREAVVRWMLRWLADRDEQVFEAEDMPIFEPEEFRVTSEGEVLLLDGARSAFDLNRDYCDVLLAERNERNANRTDAELVAAIRQTVGIRPLVEIPPLEREDKGTVEFEPSPETVAGAIETAEADVAPKAVPVVDPAAMARRLGVSRLAVRRLLYKTEGGAVLLPALEWTVPGQSKGTAIFLHEKGKSADPTLIEELLREGKTVLAVDLRGLGETQAVGPQYYRHAQFGTDGTDYYLAYLLGQSYVGMRTEDLLALCRDRCGVKGDGGDKVESVELVASGETVELVALHAAAMEPALFSTIRLRGPLRSWTEVVQAGDAPYPITNLVHGALREYDVPDLLRLGCTMNASHDKTATDTDAPRNP